MKSELVVIAKRTYDAVRIILIIFGCCIIASCDGDMPRDSPPQGATTTSPSIVVGDHDFGVVRVRGGKSSDQPLRAVIPIVNHLDREIEIQRVIGSCACTTASVDSELVQPRDTFHLTVEVTPRRDGVLAESVSVLMKDRTVFKVNLRAEVQFVETLWCHRSQVRVGKAHQRDIIVTLLRGVPDPPQPLAVTVPEGFDVKSGEWLQVYESSDDSPSRWQMTLTIVLKTSDPDAGLVEISLPDSNLHAAVRVVAADAP